VLVKITDIGITRSWIRVVGNKRICHDNEFVCGVLEGFVQGGW